MDQHTGKLRLPYIMGNQAQKHITHNEALKALDAVIHLELEATDGSAPPATPVEGQRFGIGATPSGAWQNNAGDIAAYQDGAWTFHAPQSGWLAWDKTASSLVVHDGIQWVAAAVNTIPDTLQNLSLAGVGTTADASNRLSIASPNTLFTHQGAGHRIKINKNQASDTASVLFQTAWGGRAEFGTVGDDDWQVKVSADGSTWHAAIHVDRSSGEVDFPNTNVLTECSMNLFGDSGRLAGNDATGITVGAYQWPAYLAMFNGATNAPLGKFIHNNSSYGGSGAQLHASVDALVSTIRDTAYRRYGVEFWVAEITQGTGISERRTHNGIDYHLSIFTRAQPRMPAMTHHAYLRAVDDDIMVRDTSRATVFLDGVAQPDYGIITPADGWVSVLIQDDLDPYTAHGYYPPVFGVAGKNPGDRFHMCCPALLPGLSRVNPNIGIIAALNSWLT